jgi:HK97 family phage portal protein
LESVEGPQHRRAQPLEVSTHVDLSGVGERQRGGGKINVLQSGRAQRLSHNGAQRAPQLLFLGVSTVDHAFNGRRTATITAMGWWSRWRSGEAESAQAEPQALVSIGDPALAAAWLSAGNYSGVAVSESSAVGLSGIYRALSLLSGTLGMLPLKTYTDTKGADVRKEVASVFDNPGGEDGMTPFEWKRQIVVYLKLHGNIYLYKQFNAAGGLVALIPLHPLGVQALDATTEQVRDGKTPKGGLWFKVQLEGGESVTYDAEEILHIPGMSLDGKRGMSLVDVARNSLGMSIAGERSAAKMYSDGPLLAGVVSPADDTDDFDSKEIKRQLNANISGWENASSIAVINRRLNFTPWSMTAGDAQFLESRQFSIEEVARWTGVPPHLLMQTEKQTSWGTGVEEQNRALGRTVTGPDAALIEQRCSRLLAKSRFVEFDFTGLERPSPDKEIELLIAQWNNDLLTLNEVRAVRNMPAIPGGDVVKSRWEAQVAQPV